MKLESARIRRVSWRGVAALGVMVLSFSLFAPLAGCASDGGAASPPEQAEQAESPPRGQIEPRYQPREPEPKPFYNSNLLFGMTRAVTGSTIHPGAQVPLLVLTIPLDIVFLPFAAIGGLF